MIWLVLSSLLMALSIPVNKYFICHQCPFITSAIFCFVACCMSLPFFEKTMFDRRKIWQLMMIGAIEFGLMYGCFQISLQYLASHEAALLLLTTPIYITLIGIRNKSRQFIILLSIVILLMFMMVPLVTDKYKISLSWYGILFSQLCNLSFACGQVMLKRFLNINKNIQLLSCGSILFFGATIACLPFILFDLLHNLCVQYDMTYFVHTIIFGTIFCWLAHTLWNIGVVRAPISAIAILSNIQIPLSIVLSCLMFHESIEIFRLILSMIVIGIMVVSSQILANEKI